MVCFHPILTWTKRDNLASKKYYPLSLNCLARCRAEFWTAFRPPILGLDSDRILELSARELASAQQVNMQPGHNRSLLLTLDKMIPFVDTQKAPSPIGAGSRGIAHAKLSTKGLRTQNREDWGHKG